MIVYVLTRGAFDTCTHDGETIKLGHLVREVVRVLFILLL